MPRRIAILGAGGRDFHTFNVCYRDDPTVEVVAITAAQIPHIDARRLPPELAGPRYPEGIPIHPERDLEGLIARLAIEEAVFAYSDVSLAHVEAMRARVESAGAAFRVFDPEAAFLTATKPVVAVCAVRTGCGKSPVSRHLAGSLRDAGMRPSVIRHPMPYGDLARQIVQRFATLDDLDRQACTIEEREEYEPHIRAGGVVFAGADYEQVLSAAQREGDIVIWDGGNNDAPFVRPDVLVTLLDPLRPGDELTYFPSRWNLEHADILLIAKSDDAPSEAVDALRESARVHNPEALVLTGRSPVRLADPDAVRGRRVLVVEDGPTTTHGGMGYGAGWLAARAGGAGAIVDPRPFARDEIADAFAAHPHLHDVLPALGYSGSQLEDLQACIANTPCDVVVIGTPIDLTRVIRIDKPTVRATYAYADDGSLARAVRTRVRALGA